MSTKVTAPDRWCILRTGGPGTLRLAASLAGAGFEAWTPTEHVQRRVPRAKSREYRIVPLAPTYVFVRADRLADLRAIEGADVSRHPRFSIFRYYGDTVFVGHRELHPLRQLQQDSYRASLPATGRRPGKARGEPYAIGEAVTFATGPFAGLTGFIEASDGLKTRVALQLFGNTAGVHVPTLQLRSNDVPATNTAA